MEAAARPLRSRLWRWARRVVIGFLASIAVVALACLVLEYSQPTWEVRFEGTPGTTFQGCVAEYPWWAAGGAVQSLWVPLEVPQVRRYRAAHLAAYGEKVGEEGALRVTVLRNGVVVQSEETDTPYGAPVSTPVHPARR